MKKGLIFCSSLVFAEKQETQPSSNYVKDFEMYDLDKNRLIDPQEVRTVYGMDGSLSEEELHAFWSAVDPKNQGFFNLEDFISYAVRHAAQDSDE
jgi:Ca2+-binding EF-hand superfamily protein